MAKAKRKPSLPKTVYGYCEDNGKSFEAAQFINLDGFDPGEVVGVYTLVETKLVEAATPVLAERKVIRRQKRKPLAEVTVSVKEADGPLLDTSHQET